MEIFSGGDLKTQTHLVGFHLAGTEPEYRVQWKKKKTQTNKQPKTKKHQTNQTKNPHSTKKHANLSLTVSLYCRVEPLRHFKANTCSCKNSEDIRRRSFPREHFMLWRNGYEKQNVVEYLGHLVNVTPVWIPLLSQSGQSAQLEPDCCKPSNTSQSTEGLRKAAGRPLWKWAFNFHGADPKFRMEWVRCEFAVKERGSISLQPAGEMERLPGVGGAAGAVTEGGGTSESE